MKINKTREKLATLNKLFQVTVLYLRVKTNAKYVIVWFLGLSLICNIGSSIIIPRVSFLFLPSSEQSVRQIGSEWYFVRFARIGCIRYVQTPKTFAQMYELQSTQDIPTLRAIWNKNQNSRVRIIDLLGWPIWYASCYVDDHGLHGAILTRPSVKFAYQSDWYHIPNHIHTFEFVLNWTFWTVVCAIFSFFYCFLIVTHRARHRRCFMCGYPFSTSELCTECGATTNGTNPL